MARRLFGGASSDYAYTQGASGELSVARSVSVTMYSAQTGGSQYTDLKASNGVTSISTVPVSSEGLLPVHYGPDGVAVMWAAVPGQTARTKLLATDADTTYVPAVIVPPPTGSNDTSAIATALASAMASGRDLVFQAGTYLTDKIEFEPGSAAETINWRSESGRNTTTIEKRTSDGNDLLVINTNPATFFVAGFTVQGITFKGRAGNTPHVVQTNDVARAIFRDCKFTSGLTGFHAQGGVGIHWDDCEFGANVDGLNAEGYTSFAGYPNISTVTNSEIVDNTGWGVKFDDGRGFQLIDCDIEGNGTNGTADSGGLWVGSSTGSEDSTTVLGVTCQRVWFEGNAGGAVVSLASGRNKLDSCYMVANGNATNDLKVTGGRYVMVDCDIDTGKVVSVNDTTSSSPNYITNTDIAGGVTIDATKTLYDQGAWTAYTPTIGGTGWAIGDGTIAGRYRQVGKTVHFHILCTFGSTSTFGSASPTFNYPSTMVDATTPNLHAEANDVGSNVYLMYPFALTASRTRINNIGASGAAATTTSTVPFTWASGDTLTINGTYEAA